MWNPVARLPRSIGPSRPRRVLVFLVVLIGILGAPGLAASQEGNLDVVDIDTNSPVVEGERLIVEAELVCNVVEFGCGQEVDLLVDDSVRDSRFVELGTDERTVVEFTWETSDGDAGDHLATVRPEEGRADETNVRVVQGPNFVVDIESTTSPVEEGDRLAVTATITNTGGAPGTTTVDLRIDQPVADSTRITLDAGESRTVTLAWQTGEGDAGRHVAIVSTEDSVDRTPVTVTEPANFAVEIDSTTSPVLEGEPLAVTATVTNTGGAPGTQAIDLVIDGTVEDSITVTLDETETRTVTLAWQTEEGDAGRHGAVVRSEDTSVQRAVVVEEPANFAVEIDSTTSPVLEGEPLAVTAVVTNTGDVPGNQTLELLIDGRVEDSTTVALDGTDSRTIRLTWRTGAGDAGEYTAVVSSADDSDARAVRVVEPAAFDVRIDSVPASVIVGETVAVAATVTNTGGESAAQDVVLEIDDSVEDSTTVTLAGGASRSVRLTWRTGPADAGEHVVTVASEDDTDSAEVAVAEPANFDVEIDSRNVTATAGDSVDIEATVTNTGDETATQAVVLTVDGSVVDRTEVTLAGGASRSVTLAWQTGPDDADERHEATVSSVDDSASTAVTVSRSATFDVDIQSVDAPERDGDPLVVTALVRNTGTERGTQEIRLDVDGTVADSTEVTLAGGESGVVTLSRQAGTGDPGEWRVLEVASVDDIDRREFTEGPTDEPPVTTRTAEPAVFDPTSPEFIGGAAVLFGLLVLLAKREAAGGVVDGIREAVRKRLEEEDRDDEEDGRPRAIIGVVPTDPAPLRPVLFDASLSYDPDPDGRIVRYSWKLGEREERGPRFVHVFAETGDETVGLTVWNDRGESGQDEKEFTVEEKTAALDLERVHPDAPGRDHDALVQEYLVFTNTGNTALALGGWTVHDAAEEEGRVTKGDHAFEFDEDFELAPGATVTIHTGVEPEDRSARTDEQDRHLFWGKDWPVWNNEEDLIVVQDTDRVPVVARRYRRRDGEYVIERVDGTSLEEWFEDVEIEELEGTEVGTRLETLSRLLSLVPGALFLRGPRTFLVSWLVITGLLLVSPFGGLLPLAVTMVIVGVAWLIVRRLRS